VEQHRQPHRRDWRGHVHVQRGGHVKRQHRGRRGHGHPGPDRRGTWAITGANSGTAAPGLNGTWSGVENLTGGAGNDTFTIGASGSLSGTITGGAAGTDTLVQTDGTNAWGITGANAGTVTDVVGGWTGIESLTGGSGADTFTFSAAATLSGVINGGAGTDTLVQTDAGTWTVTGVNTGTATPGLTGGGNTWTNIENLTAAWALTRSPSTRAPR